MAPEITATQNETVPTETQTEETKIAVKYTLADLDPLFKIEASINERLEEARKNVQSVKADLSAHYAVMLEAFKQIKEGSPHLGGMLSSMIAVKNVDTTKKGKRGRPKGSKNGKKSEQVATPSHPVSEQTNVVS